MIKILATYLLCCGLSLDAQNIIKGATLKGVTLPPNGSGGGGGGTPTLIAHSCSALGVNGGTTAAINTTGANFIAVISGHFSGHSPTVSDSQGGSSNSYTALSEHPAGSTASAAQIFYTNPTHVGSGHTFTLTGSTGYYSICVWAYSTMAASSPLEAATESGGKIAGGASTGQPGADGSPSGSTLHISCQSAWGTSVNPLSVNLSFTNLAQVAFVNTDHFGLACADLYEASGTAKNPTWTGSGNADFDSGNVIAAFKGQ